MTQILLWLALAWVTGLLLLCTIAALINSRRPRRIGFDVLSGEREGGELHRLLSGRDRRP